MSKYKPYKSVNSSDANNVDGIFESGILSKFLATYSDEFYGGHYVKELEKAFIEKFQVKHAISVNSWTSGLIIAVGYLDIEPGDEIISTNDLYGGSYRLFDKVFKKFGLNFIFFVF